MCCFTDRSVSNQFCYNSMSSVILLSSCFVLTRCVEARKTLFCSFKTTNKMVHAREIQLLHNRQAVGLNWNSSEHCLNRTSNQKVRIESLFVHLSDDYNRNDHLQSYHFDLCIRFAWQGFSRRKATKERAAVTTWDELITAHPPVLLWGEEGEN